MKGEQKKTAADLREEVVLPRGFEFFWQCNNTFLVVVWLKPESAPWGSSSHVTKKQPLPPVADQEAGTYLLPAYF